MKPLILTATLAAMLCAAPAAGAWEPGAAALAKAEAGGAWAAVEADGPGASGAIYGVVDINARPEAVWRAMNDCKTAARMVGNLASCKILKTGPGGAWDVREHITRGNLIVPSVRNVFHNDYTPFTSIRFQRVDGDLKAMRGEWRLIALDGGQRTRVTYENHIAANFSGPAGLMREAMRRDTPKVLMNLKRVCEGG